MSITCNHCGGSGFLNVHQIENLDPSDDGVAGILKWIATHEDHDVQVCDCCGDGDVWYGTPGEHYGSDDPRGPDGPYAYNGGLCECH